MMMKTTLRELIYGGTIMVNFKIKIKERRLKLKKQRQTAYCELQKFTFDLVNASEFARLFLSMG